MTKQQASYKQTGIGKIPKEWSVVSLGSIIDITSGYAFKSKDFQSDGTPVIKIKNVTEDGLDLSDTSFVADKFYEELKKYRVGPHDVLISLTGSNVNQLSSAVGKICMIDGSIFRALLNQRVGKIVSTEEADSVAYSYSYLRQSKIRYLLALNAKGAANQANISPSQIKSMKIPYPKKKERTKILDVLSSFDDKIELNRKMNQTLEEIGKILFKHWFVDFEFPNEQGQPYKSSGGEMVDSELGEIPKGWEVSTIDDVCQTTGGGTPSTRNSEYWVDGDIKWATPSDITSLRSPVIFDTERKINKKGLNKSSAKMLPKGTILLTSRATVGLLAISAIPITTNQGFIAIVCPKKLGNYYIYFNLLRRKNEIINKASGSTFREISKGTFRKLKIIVPSTQNHDGFTKIIKPLFQRIANNTQNIKALSVVRDSLLPRLMSGRLRVN